MKNYKILLKWLVFCLLVGTVGGIIGSAFSHIIVLATTLRQNNTWLLYLLPIGGILTVYICKNLKTSSLGTNQVLLSLNKGEQVSPKLALSVFISTVLTHLLGGSAGKEGAALQIGGGISSAFSRFFKVEEKKRYIVTICGMAALFSALFGTPLGGAIFCIEVFFRKKHLKAIPCAVISSFVAYFISKGLLVQHEKFTFLLPDFSSELLWKTGLIILCSAAICVIWVYALELSKKYFKQFIKNDYLRIILGGCLIIALTLIVDSKDYNGGGMHIVEHIFTDYEVHFEAFIFKIIFTCITVAAGFKGGEIVPTLFIGATYGAALAILLNVLPPLGAVLGMAVLFSGATNCPIATVFICAELFGTRGIAYYIVAALLSRIITGKKRLYNV